MPPVTAFWINSIVLLLSENWADGTDAWDSLSRRPARALLASLGIAIGVLALIAMLSIGEGAKREALRALTSLGTGTVRVENNFGERGVSPRNQSNLSQGLTRSDAAQVRRWLGGQGVVAYYARRDDVAVWSDTGVAPAVAIGASPNWLTSEELSLRAGRGLRGVDDRSQGRVCILGSGLAADLRVAVGARIRIEAEPCTVIGILEYKGRLLTEGTGLSTLDFEYTVVLPYRSFPWRRLEDGHSHLDGLVVRITGGDEQQVLRVSDYVEGLLAKRHRGVANYRLVVPIRLLKKTRDTQLIFQLVMGSIAGLSLLVGGIGVMNIMLANIAEQTREIGLRCSLGATRWRIARLYLWHAMLLCCTGGLFGLLGGIGTALAVQQIADWPVAFSGIGLVLGPVSAVVTGLIFGTYPAQRAASLDPAHALREA